MGKIKLKGANNARDFGGIRIGDKTIKPNCFLRSNELSKLNKNDVKVLKDHRLRTVIDLRTAIERGDAPDAVMEGVTNIHIPVFTEAVMGITHENNQNKIKMLENLPDMVELYKTIVTDEDCVSSLRKIFEIITSCDGDSAVLWHCTQGKDRCGIVSALLLFILGADKDTVYSDYHETNVAAKKKSDELYFLIKTFLRKNEEAEIVRELFLAKKEFLDGAIDAIIESCGSVDSFIREKLGVSDETKEKMRRIFLE